MSDTKYSIGEIDDLRALVENKFLWGAYVPDHREDSHYSRSYKEEEKVKYVEEQVRTLMIAGVRAEDIKNEIKARQAQGEGK